jgi:putative flavoprotein involved in K+ transport
VVGTGQSGCQIAEDLHYAGRPVYLSLGNAPRAPRRYRGRDVVAWLEEMGHYDKPITEFDDPDTVRGKTNHYVTGRDGGKEIDLRVHAMQGMQLLGRLERFDAGGIACFRDDVASKLDEADATYRRICASIDAHIAERGLDAPSEPAYVPPWYPGETPRQLNLGQVGIVAVVWAIGFETSFSLIEADVLDETGQPRHTRGVTDCEGLYFVGLPWLHSWGSGRFSHVDRDARHLVSVIVQRAQSQQAV